jgi:dUTP pyrophosphatase
MLVYLAHPNDQIDSEQGNRLRVMMANAYAELARYYCAWYEPTKPFGEPLNDCAAVVDINNTALDRADGCLVLWPEDMTSVGAPMEIYRKHERGEPVVVVGNHRSLQLHGMGIPVYKTVREATRVLWDLMAKHAARPGVQYAVMGTPSRTIRWVGEAEHAPTQGYSGDAGFDLIVAKETVITAGGWADVEHGIRCEFPPGTWAMIFGRSSAWRKRRVRVEPSIIDQGYRGPIFAAVQNIGDMPVTLTVGERIAQLIPFPLTAGRLTLERVAELSESTRGVKAFGSTGT